MIRLDSNKNEKNQLINLIKESLNHKDLELECILMNNYVENQFITQPQLINVLKRVSNKSIYKKHKTINRLDIYFPIDSNFANVRATILGYGSINNYCNFQNINNVLNNVIFQRKENDNVKNRLNIPNYNLKFNLKRETFIDKNDSLIRDLISDWKTIPKIFRYKKIYSYFSIKNDFKIDVSIIKSSIKKEQLLTVQEVINRNLQYKVVKPENIRMSFYEWWDDISKNKNNKVKVKDISIYYKTIEDSRVFENKQDYELEVEYINNKNDIKFETPKDIKNFINNQFNEYFKHIGILLQAMQNSFYIISNKEKKILIDNMQFMINKISNKISNKRNNSTDDNNKNNSLNNVNIYKPKLSLNRLFFGPLAVDLSHSNMLPINKFNINNDFVNTNNNIRLNYLVTDKADGERNLLIINKEGKCYAVNRSNDIKYLGITIKGYRNSVFDAEYVTSNDKDKLCNQIYLFDCYFSEGVFLMDREFNWNKSGGRHHYLNLFDKFINNNSNDNIIYDNDKLPLLIFIKKYYPSDNIKNIVNNNQTNIFKSCNQILSKINKKYGGLLDSSHMMPYKTDGLIFIPNNLSIYQNYKDNVINNYFISKSWYLNYKWKCANDLTIDFQIQVIKNMDSNNIDYIYINEKKYIKVNLLTKVYQKSFPNQLNTYLLNYGLKQNKIPNSYVFSPIYPFQGNIDDDNNMVNTTGICYLEVDNDNNIYCNNKDIIIDNAVVEFKYDFSREEQFRWIPLRIRENANSFNIAYDIWNLIHNPILTEDLVNPDVEKSINANPMYNRELDKLDKLDKFDNSHDNSIKNKANVKEYSIEYYNNNINRKYLSQPLKEFINFVKNYLIERVMGDLNKPYVLDMACGKMGDFFKYVKNGAFVLVGIDVNPDNLHNKFNGASSRIINNINQSPLVSKLAARTMLINGDISKNIQNGECAIDIINKYYLDILYGRVKSKNYKFNRMYNLASEGFHVIPCMFSIHYVMNNDSQFNDFLMNVSENLKDQGYFIGMCLDGNDILSMFQNTDIVIGEVNNNVIYQIEKLNNIDYSTITLGTKIKMFYETFSAPMIENLVDINYVAEIAKGYNLKLIETNKILDEPGNLLSQYKSENEENYDLINNNEDLLNWSKLNRYFIFQKVNNLNTD